MDSTTVSINKLIEALNAQQQLIDTLQQAQATDTGSENTVLIYGTQIVLAVIASWGAIWAYLRLKSNNSTQLAKQRAKNSHQISAKALEKEAEENRSFQQGMVQSTQNSYIDLVNRLMKLTEEQLNEVNQNLILFSKVVERSGSISESVNKRLATSDRKTLKYLAELGGKVDALYKMHELKEPKPLKRMPRIKKVQEEIVITDVSEVPEAQETKDKP